VSTCEILANHARRLAALKTDSAMQAKRREWQLLVAAKASAPVSDSLPFIVSEDDAASLGRSKAFAVRAMSRYRSAKDLLEDLRASASLSAALPPRSDTLPPRGSTSNRPEASLVEDDPFDTTSLASSRVALGSARFDDAIDDAEPSDP
jgi:hypothetical protein